MGPSDPRDACCSLERQAFFLLIRRLIHGQTLFNADTLTACASAGADRCGAAPRRHRRPVRGGIWQWHVAAGDGRHAAPTGGGVLSDAGSGSLGDYGVRRGLWIGAAAVWPFGRPLWQIPGGGARVPGLRADDGGEMEHDVGSWRAR